MKRLDFTASGISFRVKENPDLAHARPEGSATVRLDPGNKFAKHPRGAFPLTWNGLEIGFVPDAERGVQDEIVKIIDDGKVPEIKVLEYSYTTGKGKTKSFNDQHEGELGSVKLSFTYEESKETAAPAKQETVWSGDGKPEILHSFNEPGVEIEFYPDTHTYIYKGKQLKSVTRFVSDMYAPFDAQLVAGRCERSYGMKAADIIAMWKTNGELSANFGSAVHAAIENYEKYGERALPKMPVLREIVKSFPFVKTKVHAEVLITSVKRGMCGLCDRLLEMREGLLVCDMKVNVEATVEKSSLKNKLYPDMPNNKVTKATCQESMYAEMLVESELKVSDDVASHVWCDTWENFRRPRIVGILDKVTA